MAHHKNNRLFMTLIVITLPHLFCGEADALNALFEAGLPILHLRKLKQQYPIAGNCSRDPRNLHARIGVTATSSAADEFGLNRHSIVTAATPAPGRLHPPPQSLVPFAGRSNGAKAPLPIRISQPHLRQHFKRGVHRRIFSTNAERSCPPRLIDSRVMALGGITLSNLPQIKALGFGGAAVLGDLWQQPLSGRVSYLQTLLQASAPASETTLHTLYP